MPEYRRDRHGLTPAQRARLLRAYAALPRDRAGRVMPGRLRALAEYYGVSVSWVKY